MKRLNSEWEEISDKESQLSKLQAEARAKLSDVESREISLKYREERLDQEKVSYPMWGLSSQKQCTVVL